MDDGPNNFSSTTPAAHFPRTIYYIAVLVATVALFVLSRSNYLAFHTIVELSSVAVAITLFSIGWNARNISSNEPLTLLAISFLAVGIIDLLHTITYSGLGIFPGLSSDPATQFWIAARLISAVSYLLTALLLNQKFHFNPELALTAYLAAAAALIFLIWPFQVFPACLVEGTGLTTFKVTAEYLISVILAASGFILLRSKSLMPKPLLYLLLWSIVLTIASEMTLTLYKDIYGITNVLGHLFKFCSVVLVYRALVLGALMDPYQTLFLDLASSHRALDEELTQRRRIEKELRQSNRELDAFVHTASHDLRAPLTIITSGAEILESELNGKIEEPYLNIIGKISSQGHRMADLLNDLLSLARLGEIESPPEMISLQAVATRAIADLNQEVMAAGCRIELNDLPTVQGYESPLYQLFLNLLGNAVRYGAVPGKPITVSGERDGQYVRIFISDHGPGIPEDERASIFDLFYRGAGASKGTGTGIGLASVKKVVNLHKGRVQVEETPGGGATFRVELKDIAGLPE